MPAGEALRVPLPAERVDRRPHDGLRVKKKNKDGAAGVRVNVGDIRVKVDDIRN